MTIDFFAEGDALVVVFPPQHAAAPGQPGPALPHGGVWLRVGADGVVRAYTGKVEVGQGTRTALAALVAEELGVPRAAVRVVMGDTDTTPWDIGTFGSRSMPDVGARLRVVAAAARALLAELAARHPHGGERPAPGFAELVRGVRRVERVVEATLTPPAAWTQAGEPAADPDAVDAVTGARRFVSDLTRPGMWHGKILHPPARGAKLRSLDASAARALPDVVVVHDGDVVAVAAPDPLAAGAALRALRAEWDTTPQPAEREIVDYLRAHPDAGEGFWGPTHHEAGDVDRALETAPVKLAETYTAAYIAHVPLECRCAIAEWNAGRLTVWAGTQRPFGVRQELAEALGVAQERIRVIVPAVGGGFGGKHVGDVAIAAARLARAAERPVKILYSREEEFSHGYLRPLAVIDVRAGAAADADGTLQAWSFYNLSSGAAAIMTPYRVPNQRIDHQPAASPLPQGAYRALAATANCFARESHMDELAVRLKIDPLAYRLRHLADERLAEVLRAVAERAGWEGRRRDGAGQGFGIAAGVEKGGRVATFAEVRVDGERRLRIVRLVTGFECGAIVNPQNLRSQVEGATIMGLGGALFEAIHFADGRILNPRLSQYRVPRFRDAPPIEVLLIDRTEEPPAGGGETPIIAVAPAIGNAIRDAIGVRPRALPMAPGGFVR
jgi:CO/xanthine dehydrogenase Mo-binding subunit